MEKVSFINADGKAQEITVTNEVYAAIQDLDRKERLNERKETRHCQSLEQSLDNGFDVADPTVDTMKLIERKAKYKALYKALNTLPSKQRQLIYLVFFKGVSQKEIARKENVSKAAITIRLQRILKKLKKLLD